MAEEDPEVEALLGFRDFVAVGPRYRSAAVTEAAYTALRRWMRLHTYDADGFYTITAWRAYYAAAMVYTG